MLGLCSTGCGLRKARCLVGARFAAGGQEHGGCQDDAGAAAKGHGVQSCADWPCKATRRDPGFISWDAMNFFVHAGLHPLARTSEGFPRELAANVVRQSNAVQHMAARLLARLSDDSSGLATSGVDAVWMQHEDCLPVATARSERG